MSRFHLAPGESLKIVVSDTRSFKSRLPEILDALIECGTAVNQRYLEAGKPLL